MQGAAAGATLQGLHQSGNGLAVNGAVLLLFKTGGCRRHGHQQAIKIVEKTQIG